MQSFDKKKTKSKMNPKIPLEKNKERINRKSEEKEKKAMAAVLAVMLTSLEIVFERENCLMGELCFVLAVTFLKIQLDTYFSYSCS